MHAQIITHRKHKKHLYKWKQTYKMKNKIDNNQTNKKNWWRYTQNQRLIQRQNKTHTIAHTKWLIKTHKFIFCYTKITKSYTNTHTNKQTHKHIHMDTHTHTHKQTNIHTYTGRHTDTHKYTHTHKHTNTN